MCTLWCTRCGGRSAELHSPGGGEWGACRRAATAQCRMQGSVLLRVGLALQSAVVCLQLKVNSCSSAQPPCPPPPADGYNDVADDESMGWARYAHSMRIFVLNSGLFYLK